MSRTRKGSKGPGAEYWSRRPVSRKFGATPSPYSKKRTHSLERIEEKELLRKEAEELEEKE